MMTVALTLNRAVGFRFVSMLQAAELCQPDENVLHRTWAISLSEDAMCTYGNPYDGEVKSHHCQVPKLPSPPPEGSPPTAFRFIDPI
jgi:hypothetical protein